MKTIKFQKLRDVKSPERGTSKSAGIDFFIPSDYSPVFLHKGMDAIIPSGIRVKIPEGYALIAFNKSGVAKKGLSIGACVVDEDYTGEIHLHVYNRGLNSVRLVPGQKLVQFILIPVCYANLEEDEKLSFRPTERGSGAFGSTGEY